jgi:YHS domain-containing protein
MNYLIVGCLMLFLSSCAQHHHNDSKHHHHEKSKKNQIAFEKQCAHSVSKNKFHTKGNEHFKIEHHGVVYYFSTKKKMDDFSADLKKNITNANKMWETRAER